MKDLNLAQGSFFLVIVTKKQLGEQFFKRKGQTLSHKKMESKISFSSYLEKRQGVTKIFGRIYFCLLAWRSLNVLADFFLQKQNFKDFDKIKNFFPSVATPSFTASTTFWPIRAVRPQ